MRITDLFVLEALDASIKSDNVNNPSPNRMHDCELWRCQTKNCLRIFFDCGDCKASLCGDESIESAAALPGAARNQLELKKPSRKSKPNTFRDAFLCYTDFT